MNTEPIFTLLRPIYLMLLSASFIPHTAFNLVTSSNFAPFTSFSDFKDHWFARFWVFFGPIAKQYAGPTIAPLVTHAAGVLLDIGPGQGHLLHLYSQPQCRAKITKIYAVEPNKGHHAALRKSAVDAGLGDIFEILDCKIETLESEAGIKRHSIDTIVTLQVLCSINDSETLIKELRTYLKPNGGKWIACEHVRRWDNGGVAWYQSKLDIIWPTFFNGCSLTRDTATYIEKTGGWDMEKSGGGLQPLATDSAWTALPTKMGILISQ